MVFGRQSETGAAQAASPTPRKASSVAAIPQASAAVLTPVVKPLAGKAAPKRAVAMPTCFQQYERVYAQCGAGDPSCQLKAGDHWDVCEATGFWPAG